jgi:hypothetical protein
MQPTQLSYDRGTILIRGEAKVPYSAWDERVKAFRAQALYYGEIVRISRQERSLGDQGRASRTRPHILT